MPPESPSTRSTFIGVFVPSSSKLNNHNHNNRLQSNPTQFKSIKSSIPLNFSASKNLSESDEEDGIILVQNNRYSHNESVIPLRSGEVIVERGGERERGVGLLESRKQFMNHSSSHNRDIFEDTTDLDMSSLLIGRPNSSNSLNASTSNGRRLNPFPSVLLQPSTGISNSRFTIRNSSILNPTNINPVASSSNLNYQNYSITSSTPSTSTSFSTAQNYSSPHSPISHNNDPSLNSSSAILSPSYSSTTNSNHAEEEEEEEGDLRREDELETPPTESASPELEIDQLDEDQEMEEPVIISMKLDKGKGKEVVRKLTLKVQDISTSSVCHQDRTRSDKPKMSCSNYPKCVYVYCDRCISKNYPHLSNSFQKNASFLCPSCSNNCNCSRCLQIEAISKLALEEETVTSPPTSITRVSSSRLLSIRRGSIGAESVDTLLPVVVKGSSRITKPRSINRDGTERRVRRGSLKKQQEDEEIAALKRLKAEGLHQQEEEEQENVVVLGREKSKRRRKKRSFSSPEEGYDQSIVEEQVIEEEVDQLEEVDELEEYDYNRSISMEIIPEEIEEDDDEEETTIISSRPLLQFPQLSARNPLQLQPEEPIKRKRGRPFGTHPPKDSTTPSNHIRSGSNSNIPKRPKSLLHNGERRKPGPKKRSSTSILDPYDTNFNASASHSTTSASTSAANDLLANGIDPDNGEEVHQTRGASRRASWGGNHSGAMDFIGADDLGPGDDSDEEDYEEGEGMEGNLSNSFRKRGRGRPPLTLSKKPTQKRRMTVGGGESSAYDFMTTTPNWKNNFVRRRRSSFSSGFENDYYSSGSSDFESESDSDNEPTLGIVRAKDNWEPIVPPQPFFKSTTLATDSNGGAADGTRRAGRLVIWHEGPSRKRRRMGDGSNNTSSTPAVLHSSQGPPKLPILPDTLHEFNLLKQAIESSVPMAVEGTITPDEKLTNSFPNSPIEPMADNNITIEEVREPSPEGIIEYTRISVEKAGILAEGIKMKQLSIIRVDGKAKISVVPSSVSSSTPTSQSNENRVFEALDSGLVSSRSSNYPSNTPSTPSAPTYNLNLSPTGRLFDDLSSTPISRNPSPRFGIIGNSPLPIRNDIFPSSFAISHLYEDATSSNFRQSSPSTLSSDSLLAPFEESRPSTSQRSSNLSVPEVAVYDMEMDVDSTSPSLLPFNQAELDKFTDEQLGSAVKFALRSGPGFFNEVSDDLLSVSPLPASTSRNTSPSSRYTTPSVVPDEELNSYLNSDAATIISSELVSSPFRFDAELDTAMYYDQISATESSVTAGADTILPSSLSSQPEVKNELRMSTTQVEAMIQEEIKKIESDSMERSCSWLRDEGGVDRWVPDLVEV